LRGGKKRLPSIPDNQGDLQKKLGTSIAVTKSSEKKEATDSPMEKRKSQREEGKKLSTAQKKEKKRRAFANSRGNEHYI